MKAHTDKKPYKYSQCDKSFAQESNPTLHMRTHTREKPHPCSQCDNPYVRKSDLINHI